MKLLSAIKIILCKLLVRLMSTDQIVSIIGQSFAWLMLRARKWNNWESFKKQVIKINGWITILLEVYDDDTLTPDEEKKIADKLRSSSEVSRVKQIIRTESDKQIGDSK